MVLEDHDFQRSIASRILKGCGATEVIEAANGVEALRLIAQQPEPIEVLLCDLKMPDMDGLEFVRHISENRSASSVILVSGLEAPILRAAENMAKSYGVCVLGAIEKPISHNKLLPLVLRHFGQKIMPARPRAETLPFDEIRLGIERGEFLPYYQPKVSMRNGALHGAEVLMRWRHPQRGLIPPSAFIPIMEDSGLITPATLSLVSAALAQARQWADAGLAFPVAVNISVESLKNTRLPEELLALAAAADVPPGMLTLEVTETIAMTDLGRSLETLARLRMQGFELSIDDYGTGFSSMQQLTRIPFNELKIDQVFVTGSAGQPMLQALLETSVTMARRLKLRSVAEGVETAEDWDVAARVGCDVAQGYFIAKPMPAEELLEWHRGWLGRQSAFQINVGTRGAA